MKKRNEMISAIKKRADDTTESVSRLVKERDRLDVSDLSNAELTMLIALMKKGFGCIALVGVPLLEISESEVISASHKFEGMSPVPFELDRLTKEEQDTYESLAGRVIWG